MEFENIINEQLDSMDLSELEELLNEAPAEMTIADEISVNSIINDLLNGQPIFDSENLMDNIKELFFISSCPYYLIWTRYQPQFHLVTTIRTLHLITSCSYSQFFIFHSA